MPQKSQVLLLPTCLDANRTATLTYRRNRVLAGDTVNVSASGLFDNKNVGTCKMLPLPPHMGGIRVTTLLLIRHHNSIHNQRAITFPYYRENKVYDANRTATLTLPAQQGGWQGHSDVSSSACLIIKTWCRKTINQTGCYGGAGHGYYSLQISPTTANITQGR
jgi:hypothetical protein